MYGYGIDAALSSERDSNRIIKLQGKWLIDEGPIESLKDGVTLDESSPKKAWNELASEVATELDRRNAHPLGVNAPLSLAFPGSGRGRPFEQVVRATFNTPSGFEPWPKGPSGWACLSRLWSEVAYRLVEDHDWRLWAGGRDTLGSQLVVEVLPRASWMNLAAALGVPVTKGYSDSVQVRVDTLAALEMRFGDRPHVNDELRNAAVCAFTVGKVATRTSGYLGAPIEPHPDGQPAFVGGGIAVPWLR